MPECCLLFHPGEVRAAYDVKVRPGLGHTAADQHMSCATQSAADLADIVSVRQAVGHVDELCHVPRTAGRSSGKDKLADLVLTKMQAGLLPIIVKGAGSP